MTALAQIPDRLQRTGHLGSGSVYYLYDASGQRVRKIHLDQLSESSCALF